MFKNYIPLPTDRTIRERVKRGAKYLDEHLDPKVVGFNWRDKITNDLELSNASMCVLGHVFGGYTEGLQRLAELNGLDWEQKAARAPVTHGFCVPYNQSYVIVRENQGSLSANGIYWAKLELEWRRELGLDVNKMQRDPETGWYRDSQ